MVFKSLVVHDNEVCITELATWHNTQWSINHSMQTSLIWYVTLSQTRRLTEFNTSFTSRLHHVTIKTRHHHTTDWYSSNKHWQMTLTGVSIWIYSSFYQNIIVNCCNKWCREMHEERTIPDETIWRGCRHGPGLDMRTFMTWQHTVQNPVNQKRQADMRLSTWNWLGHEDNHDMKAHSRKLQ